MVKVHFFLHSKIKFKRINHTFIMKKEYHSKTSNIMTPGRRDLVLVCGYIDHIVKNIISLINSFLFLYTGSYELSNYVYSNKKTR